MKALVVAATLVLVLLASSAYAPEEHVISGSLSDYGKGFVTVDGTRIGVCADAKIFDDNGAEITVDGLVATETVVVTVKGGCAIKVKAVTVKN